MIDDDPALCTRLQEYVAQYDIALLTCGTPSKGLTALAQHNPDLVLLDVMLPEKDGFTVCKDIREQYDTPIIMLTARGELTDKVLGLEIGADDYLAKPFEPRELVARINVLLRRGNTRTKKELKWSFLGLDIYPEHHKLVLDGQEIDITGMEFRLLRLLAGNPGRIYSRDELLNELKGMGSDVYSRSVDILLSRLRNKLKDSAQSPKYIKTIRNMGYCFVGKRL
ncbi:response regulator transcription factor [Pseudoalteromonas sp. JBTF-M23]|uniref:Response regulator transcription factor n=2 Tax=Pseudoalteromonas caenipelagi TaxID=2726988 RepID=A0A849VDL1_9GAMM|nr:response regulator transcription factor [Pseudoalteromonas caenipelagi]NOU51482.1 response regulator transcription factor [Pseudoalteromonas caenipelagi]